MGVMPPGVRAPGAPAPVRVGVPGMSTPGAGSPGAGAGKHTHKFRMPAMVQGRVHMRPARYVPQKGRMQSAAIVFEVFDDRETAKATRGEPSMSGGEVFVNLPNDRRTADLFSAMGYPESSWERDGDGFILPIDSVLHFKPLMLVTVEQVEGNTPGKFFANCSDWTLVRTSTTQAATPAPVPPAAPTAPAAPTGVAS